jgi:hypothetical protein
MCDAIQGSLERLARAGEPNPVEDIQEPLREVGYVE